MTGPASSQTPRSVQLRDGGMAVTLLDFGATTQSWMVGDMPLVLGYASARDYLTDRNFLGAIAGRVANRIGGAQYVLDGDLYKLAANDGEHQLHGGPDGLFRQTWHLEQTARNSATLTYHSPDGENGFPGNVSVVVTVELVSPRLRYVLTASADQPTPISPAQHNYYRIGDHGPEDCTLRIAADRALVRDAEGIMTGGIVPVAGTPLDFRECTRIASRTVDDFVLFGADRNGAVAELQAPDGRTLRFYSDQDGAQLYTGDGLRAPFAPRSGICFEPSGYPNAVNIPAFPSVIHGPERPYRQVLEIEYGQ